MNKYDRQLQAVEQESADILAKSREITEGAMNEGRALTDEEKGALTKSLAQLDVLKGKKAEIEDSIATLQRVEDLGNVEIVEDKSKSELPEHRKATSIGEAFVNSIGYKSLKSDPNGFRGTWRTGAVEVDGKAVLDSSGVGSEGSGLIQPAVQPGILPILTQRLTIADLMGSAVTDSPLVRYMVEKTATSGAAGVAESGEKPESTLEFDAVDEPVKKIATFLPVTDEMIEDVPQLTSYINGRLSLFVRQEEEDQLLNATGAGDDLNGLLNRVPMGNQDVFSDTEDAQMMDHIYAGITKCREAYVEPDAIVINPADWATIQLLKDGTERYLAGGPFSAAPDSLWGKRVVVTNAISPNTALVGDFAGSSAVYRKGGLSVEASNSHADYFQHNKTAIRAEERLALAVYRPEAFATVDLDHSA